LKYNFIWFLKNVRIGFVKTKDFFILLFLSKKNSNSLLFKECFREKRYQSVTGLIGVNCFDCDLLLSLFSLYHTLTLSRTHSHTHPLIHSLSHALTHSHTHPLIHSHMHLPSNINTHTHLHKDTHTHTHLHKDTHTHTHTHLSIVFTISPSHSTLIHVVCVPVKYFLL